ncbi:unnamed protein product [Fusarium langsethiae]|nr:unnamed protein product [Fusarium langsethiae]
MTGPRWLNPVAGPGIEQENGRQYFVTGPLSKELAKNRPQQMNQNPIYISNPISIGGNQYNRNFVEIIGEIRGATVPDMSGDV